jgi:hypothetical protein
LDFDEDGSESAEVVNGLLGQTVGTAAPPPANDHHGPQMSVFEVSLSLIYSLFYAFMLTKIKGRTLEVTEVDFTK